MRFPCVIFYCLVLGFIGADEILISVDADKFSDLNSVFDLHFTKEDIRKTHSRDLGEFLSNIQGFQITKTYQGLSSASIRGLSVGNILVFWNGINLTIFLIFYQVLIFHV